MRSDPSATTMIRILFYTDSFINHAPDPELKSWGLSEMERLIVYKTRGIVTYQFDLTSRHLDKQRLDSNFLGKYHEVWIFGVVNREGDPFELADDELAALKDWMDDGGGLFLTGDHSVPFNSQFCQGDLQRFLNLGFSLGNRIKRAGEMRLWKGSPTACLESLDNFNTQEGNGSSNLDDPDLDNDDIAQTLFEMPDPPHPLFWWKIETSGKILPIEKFPDHGHEGKLLKPDTCGEYWPPQASDPVVAARGLDKRFPDKSRVYDLVMAWDGDTAGVGRIVTDSSFHHYLNINLRKLRGRTGRICGCGCGYLEPNSDLDQVAQYYANLALWLAPKTLRQNIKLELMFRVAEHPEIFEVQGTNIPYLGRMARHVMVLEAGDLSNLHRLATPGVSESKPEPFDELLHLLILGQNSFIELSTSKHEILLGSIIRTHQLLTLPIEPLVSRLQTRHHLLESAIPQGLKLATETVPELRDAITLMTAVPKMLELLHKHE